MKRKFFIYLFFFLAMTAIMSTKDYIPAETQCRSEKYATLEPGTCLQPKTLRLLNAIDKLEKNPYNNEFAQKVINLVEPKMHKTVDMVVPAENFNVPIRIYYPTKKSETTPTPIILYIHGGGFVHGNIEDYDMALKKFAKVSRRIVVSLNYRLAPEFPFPNGLNDANAVLNWLSVNFKKIGGSSKKIIVMGDSAGANLATVLALKNRDEENYIIAGQILLYPPTTFVEREYPSRVFFLRDPKRTYLLTEEFILSSKAKYLPDSIGEKHPYLSPLEADLSGNLAPILIMNPQIDPLRDEGRLYAEKLRQSGQDVSYIEYEGIIHGFFNFYMIYNEAKSAMKAADSFIDECCSE